MKDKAVLITGGTGSLGRALVTRLADSGRVVVFSRDEKKQHDMRLDFLDVEFLIGDIRDPDAVRSALRGIDVVFNAAALKQVPDCEYHPWEAVLTNVAGANNLVRAAQYSDVETVIGVSTDKAVEPVNAMGMTKALQERVFIQANLRSDTRFTCVRYGNVMGSRGSVIPLFQEQVRRGGPVTVTDRRMTRFMLTLDQAVDTVLAAARFGLPGEVLVPDAPSSLVTDIAAAMTAGTSVETTFTGIRPGEKIHEIMVSDDEALRTVKREGWFGIQPMLPELGSVVTEPALTGEFSSAGALLDAEGTRALLGFR